jgi:putative RecB family exonuclease
VDAVAASEPDAPPAEPTGAAAAGDPAPGAAPTTAGSGLVMPRSLSPSRISQFRSCPQAFRFGVLEGLPQPPSEPALRGTLVHGVLERLYLRPPAQRTRAVAHADLVRTAASLADHPEAQALGLDAEAWAGMVDAAGPVVDAAFELEDPPSVRAIGVELFVRAEVDGRSVRGIIDRLDLDADGELVVVDYKTGASPREEHADARMAGVHLYALMVEHLLGRRPARVQLVYLAAGEIWEMETTEQRARGLERRIVALWDAIERSCATGDFRPRPSVLCDWCAYKEFCPAYGGDPAGAVVLRERYPALLRSPRPGSGAVEPADAPARP